LGAEGWELASHSGAGTPWQIFVLKRLRP